ncbi:MAG: hypothetical protein CVU56_12905 [Deltaproteobacteria bacterium HGW-Deltaproteobacteria-14]|nr:MAG: hypothetical protein CVU56_12905 [Deltaproteobacteria bacterium HGW-Deltaproteobacteria-14]
MPTYPAKESAFSLAARLSSREGLGHLRVRARGPVLTIESGPEEDPVQHARLRRDTVHLWVLEMPARGGRWERTPFRAQLDALEELLVEQFGWCLEPIC